MRHNFLLSTESDRRSRVNNIPPSPSERGYKNAQLHRMNDHTPFLFASCAIRFIEKDMLSYVPFVHLLYNHIRKYQLFTSLGLF